MTREDDLKYLFNKAHADMINEPPHYNVGEIETIDYITDVLKYNKNLTALDGYYLGTILKYLSTRLGNKASKREDMQKAQYYLNRWLNE